MEFFSKYKKILLIVGFVIIIFVMGYMLYVLFFKTEPSAPVGLDAGDTGAPAGFPISGTGPGGEIIKPTGRTGLPGEGRVVEKKPDDIARGDLTKIDRLNDVASLGTTLNSNGSDLQYYNKNDGKFYRITKDGLTSKLSDKVFHSVENIKWSPNKNKAILEYPDGANIIYDFDANKQITLPKHWEDFDFSPTGNQIVTKSIGLDVNNRWLAVVNDDGSKSQAIEAIGENGDSVYPAWSPGNQIIAMYTQGVGFDRQEVFFVGLNDENFKSTIVEGRGFQPKWQPSGDRLLYSVYSSDTDLKPNLWIVNANGENIGTGRKNLNIETWADKCTFANDAELYCAVPENLEEGAGLFPELANNTKDNLYKIDTQTGIKKLVAIPDGSYNMSNLIISDNGYYLYFTDEKSETLHKIRLK